MKNSALTQTPVRANEELLLNEIEEISLIVMCDREWIEEKDVVEGKHTVKDIPLDF